MQEVVAEKINDLEFLKLQLTTEIYKIENDIERLGNFTEVKKYKKKEGSNERDDDYIEVKKYEESLLTIKDYAQKLKYLGNLISVNGIIYNKEKDKKILYSQVEALKHLLNLKERAGLSLQTNIVELNRYINAVRKSLQEYNHYDDDEVIDEILGYKVYQNPHNYDIKNVEELPSLKLEYLSENENLTEREKEAFFGSNACKSLVISKEQDKEKRIGVKKNV